jgi:phage terminase large subunit-like protein
MSEYRYPPALDVRAVKIGGFPEFVRINFGPLESHEYRETWHVRTCAAEIERAYRAGPMADILLNLPPGHAKTTLLTLWQLYVWAEIDPAHRFFAGAYTGELGKREAEKIIRLLKTDGWRRRWPHVQLVDGKANADDDPAAHTLHTSKGGLRFSTTPRGKVTGWHFNSHIYDDLLKAQELTQASLAHVNTWLGSAMATRFLPERRIRIFGMQRLCVGDPCDAVVEGSKVAGAAPLYRIVLPMEYDPEVATRLGLSAHERELDIRTRHGELLDARYTPEAAAALKATLLRLGGVADAQLQQCPGAQGKYFQAEWFARRWSHDTLPERFDRIVDSWDLTFDDTSSRSSGPDYVAGTRIGMLGPDYYVLRRYPAQPLDFPATLEAIVTFRKTNKFRGMHETVIEKKANGAAVLSTIRGVVPNLVPYLPTDSKQKRAAVASVPCRNGHVFLGPEDDDLVGTLTGFPAVLRDDEVDSLTMGILHLQETSPGFSQLAATHDFAAIKRKLGL